MKTRPPRIYISKTGKYYFRKYNKKVYIKNLRDFDKVKANNVPRNENNTSLKNIVKVIINNTKYHRRLKVPKKNNKLKTVHFQYPIFNGLVPSDFGFTLQNSSGIQDILNNIKKLPTEYQKHSEPFPIKYPIIKVERNETSSQTDEIPFLSRIRKPQMITQKRIVLDFLKDSTDNTNKDYKSFIKWSEKHQDLKIGKTNKLSDYGDKLLYEDEFRTIILNLGHNIEEEHKEQEYKEEESQYHGDGKYSNFKDGLYDDQVQDIIKSKTRKLVPVIMADQIKTLVPLVDKHTKEFGFIINKESSIDGDGTHWMACFIDIPRAEVDFYDPLVSQPSKEFLKGIKFLIDKIDPELYLKIKVNNIKDQANDTSNCGFFCAKFLIDMFKGKKFKQASRFDNSKIGEENIEKFKHYL